MEDFIRWVPAGDDVGKVATHTSFMDVNYAMRRSKNDYIPTADQGTTWYLLVGATGEHSDGSELEALARSYQEPAIIEVHRDPGEPEELHRGRVLEEGYDFSLRAYTFRKTGDDRINLTMTPKTPQINPVFVFDGWTSSDARVFVNDAPLDRDRYQTQVCGHDLTVWIDGTFTEPTRFSFLG
jgi:hypothetical protein